jgi:hypothetical protein
MPDELTTILSEIWDRGFLVSNLFQLSDGTWQANLRNSTSHTEFARADSPHLALSLALDLLETAEPFPQLSIVSYDEPARKSLAEILAHHLPPIERRKL